MRSATLASVSFVKKSEPSSEVPAKLRASWLVRSSFRLGMSPLWVGRFDSGGCKLLAGQQSSAQLDFTRCLKADDTGRNTSKRNRNSPSKKKPPSCGAPKVKGATARQIRIARELL